MPVRSRGRWVLAIGAVGAALVSAFWLAGPHAPRGPAPMREIGLPPGGSTLIFAPHEDDETLGCAGYLQQAVARHAPVHVALMTNGEYPELSLLLSGQAPSHSPEAFLRLGYTRQQETLSALHFLGLRPFDVTFLGYPNQYLTDMWLPEHWLPANPVRSARTHAIRSPYRDSMTPHAVYCGASMLADVETLLRRFRPRVVIAVHPNDIHVDHWPTGAVVRMALEELANRGEASAGQAGLLTYLIHREHWPVPPGHHPRDPLDPPAPLARLDQTRWETLPLTPAQTQRKYQATSRYRSQGGDYDLLLQSFARRNELFGELPVLVWPAGTEVPVRVVTRDPPGDHFADRTHPDGDLVAVSLGRREDRLLATLQTRKPATPGITYHLSLHAGAAQPSQRVIVHYAWQGTSASAQLVQRGVRARVPPAALRARPGRLSAPWPGREDTRFVLVRAWTTRGDRLIDETATTLLRISPG